MANTRVNSTTYTTNNKRNETGSYVYDPTTGKWIPPSPSSGTTPTPPSSSSAPTSSNQELGNVPSSQTGNESTSTVDSKTQADKQYIEEEFNTLVGELVVRPSKKSIRIRVNDTVEVLGIGSHLSGKYFVSSIKRTLNKDSGYSETLTVMKNGFGDSLKKKTDNSNDSTSSRLETVDKSVPEFKVGDTVKIVGEAIYSNTDEGTVVPAWVKEKTLTIQQISSDGNRVLLMPINQWTYIRYVQKA